MPAPDLNQALPMTVATLSWHRRLMVERCVSPGAASAHRRERWPARSHPSRRSLRPGRPRGRSHSRAEPRALIAARGACRFDKCESQRAGEPLHDAHEIRREFSSEVDLIVTGEVPGAVSSTLVDLCGASPRVVRDGAYAWASAGAGKPSK
jgi:hypothetical protein